MVVVSGRVINLDGLGMVGERIAGRIDLVRFRDVDPTWVFSMIEPLGRSLNVRGHEGSRARQ